MEPVKTFYGMQKEWSHNLNEPIRTCKPRHFYMYFRGNNLIDRTIARLGITLMWLTGRSCGPEALTSHKKKRTWRPGKKTSSLRLSASAVSVVEKIVYGTSSNNNLKGQVAIQYDQSGKTSLVAYDFKGNLLSLTKQLCTDYQNTIDWDNSPALEQETFDQSFTYDAMFNETNF